MAKKWKLGDLETTPPKYGPTYTFSKKPSTNQVSSGMGIENETALPRTMAKIGIYLS